jgi:hypothetical protein
MAASSMMSRHSFGPIWARPARQVLKAWPNDGKTRRGLTATMLIALLRPTPGHGPRPCRAVSMWNTVESASSAFVAGVPVARVLRMIDSGEIDPDTLVVAWSGHMSTPGARKPSAVSSGVISGTWQSASLHLSQRRHRCAR